VKTIHAIEQKPQSAVVQLLNPNFAKEIFLDHDKESTGSESVIWPNAAAFFFFADLGC